MEQEQYTADGRLVKIGSTLVCMAVSPEVAEDIAFSLNYMERARVEARERAEFYRRVPD